MYLTSPGADKVVPTLNLRKPKLKGGVADPWGCGGPLAHPTSVPSPPACQQLLHAVLGPADPHLPPPDVSHVFPEVPAPDLGSVLLQESVTLHDVRALQLAYRRHCEVTAPSPAPGLRWVPPSAAWGQRQSIPGCPCWATGSRQRQPPSLWPRIRWTLPLFTPSLLMFSLGLERPHCSPAACQYVLTTDTCAHGCV